MDTSFSSKFKWQICHKNSLDNSKMDDDTLRLGLAGLLAKRYPHKLAEHIAFDLGINIERVRNWLPTTPRHTKLYVWRNSQGGEPMQNGKAKAPRKNHGAAFAPPIIPTPTHSTIDDAPRSPRLAFKTS